MSVLDKLINAMKFNDDPYDEENDGDETAYYDDAPDNTGMEMGKEDEEMEELENTNVPRTARRRPVSDREAGPAARSSVKRQYSESGMEVCIVKPTSVNDARDVTDLILDAADGLLT